MTRTTAKHIALKQVIKIDRLFLCKVSDTCHFYVVERPVVARTRKLGQVWTAETDQELRQV